MASKRKIATKCFLIGLTGGIACGKSSVSRALRNLGAVVIDADRVGHQTYESGTACHAALVREFGTGVVSEEGGGINRKALGKIVFGNPAQLKRLTNIVWPEIKKAISEHVAYLESKSVPAAIVEAAILVEAEWMPLFDEVELLSSI